MLLKFLVSLDKFHLFFFSNTRPFYKTFYNSDHFKAIRPIPSKKSKIHFIKSEIVSNTLLRPSQEILDTQPNSGGYPLKAMSDRVNTFKIYCVPGWDKRFHFMGT